MKAFLPCVLVAIGLFSGCEKAPESGESADAPAPGAAPSEAIPSEAIPSEEKPKEASGPVGEAPFVALNVDAAGAEAMLKESPDLIVLDVRTPEEFAEGHIEGAKNIDFKAADFEAKAAELDRKPAYLVHCRSGARSGQSMAVFEKLGFENIIHLNTGFNDWKDSGKPVAK